MERGGEKRVKKKDFNFAQFEKFHSTKYIVLLVIGTTLN